MADPTSETLFAAVGEETFRRLVAGFYRRVAADPVLRPLYPDEDLAAAEERLRLFLIQYWGGPATYSEQRGHPRLRRRHAPFAVGAAQRDAWLRNMRAALDEVGMDPQHEAAVWEHLHRAAFMLQNVPEEPGDGSGSSPG
jgi:hemoglobin